MKKISSNNFNRQSFGSKFSEDSEGWIVACLDPYHDFQYEVAGLPDERVAPSVVQIHNQTVNLTVPASAGGNNWDASILFTGINSPINCEADNILGGMVTATGSNIHLYSSSNVSTGTSFGALNLWAGMAGSTMSTGSPKTTGDSYSSLGSVLKTDRCRLIGVGIEIHNTTAEIYKQGSITVAMLPDTACDTSMIYYHDTAGAKDDTFVQADRALVQACTLPPLLAVPGSSTWPASEGVYAIPRMTMVPRDVLSYAYTPGVATNQGASTRLPILYGTDGKVATPEPTGSHAEGGYSQCLFKPFGPNGFSPLQIWCSGLSAQTTLTVSFRTIVEYFPALNSPLLPLANPSPIFDPKALACYSAVAARAPYAVPVDQNSAGDYFKKILRVLGESLSVISPVFGSYAPIAQGLGKAMVSGSDLIRKDEAGPRSAQRGRKVK